MADTPIGTLLWTVIESILEVFILCVAGWVLAQLGIVDRTTQKKMNRINVSLFTPCLLFSKVAFYLSPEKLRELWIIPIFFCVVTLISAGWAWALAKMLRLRRSQRSFAMAASMFMNSNSLPIALMQSLVVTVPGLKWGADDTRDGMLGRALTYLVVYSTLGMMLRWSYGVHLLSQADEEEVTEHSEDAHEQGPLLTPGESGFPPPPNDPVYEHGRPNFHPSDLHSTDYAAHTHTHEPPNTLGRTLQRGNSKLTVSQFASFPEIPTLRLPGDQTSTSSSSMLNAAATTDDEDDEWRDPRSLSTPTTSRFRSYLRRIRNFFKKINEFMTVPMWASIASLVVACIQPLQHFLDEHARPFKGAVVNAGNCSIPLTLIVLGAYFYTPPVRNIESKRPTSNSRRDETPSTVRTIGESEGIFSGVLQTLKLRRRPSGKFSFFEASDDAARAERRGERSTVAVAVVSRMILTPAVLLPFFALFAKLGAHAVFEDPVFLVSNVLLISSPPALTLAQITQAASGDAFERLISKTIFWSYCVFTPPLTIFYVMIGMLLTKM